MQDLAKEKIEQAKETASKILDLSGFHLIELPVEISELSSLELLLLSGNRLSSIEEIKNLVNLKALWIDGNSLSSIEPIRGLVNLKRLRCGNNQIKKIDPIENLTQLNEIDFHNNQVTTITSISSLKNLVKVDFSNNYIDSVEVFEVLGRIQKYQRDEMRSLRLGNSPMLEELYLSGNDIKSFSPIQYLTSLLRLDLGCASRFADTDKEENPEGFLKATKQFYTCSEKIHNLEPFGNLDSLIELRLNGRRLESIEPLIKCKTLERLDLESTHLISVEPLRGLKNLTELQLGDNGIKDISPLAGLINLKILNVSNNKIKYIEADALANLYELVDLNLKNNKIVSIEKFGCNSNLAKLNLSQNRFEDISFLSLFAQKKAAWLLEQSALDDAFSFDFFINLKGNNIKSIEPLLMLLEADIEIRWSSNEINGIFCSENPWDSPMPELLRQGKQAVIAHFKSKKSIKNVPIGIRPSPKKVFISYSKEDEEALKKLKSKTNRLVDAKEISVWTDKELNPGDVWDEKIKEALQAADIYIFLVSDNLLDTDYVITTEMTIAKKKESEGNALIIPIILKPCDWNIKFRDSEEFVYFLGKFNALPEKAIPIICWPNPDLIWHEVYKALKQKVKQ